MIVRQDANICLNFEKEETSYALSYIRRYRPYGQ